jgi:hypothetical protein
MKPPAPGKTWRRGPADYILKRCLKILWKKCRNKSKIEASVAEVARVEVSNFTKAYYTENLPNMMHVFTKATT